MSATITLTASVTGPNGVAGIQIDNIQTIASPLGDVANIPLASGANTIPLPAGAAMWAFIPPPANSVALTVNGIAVSPNQPYGPIYLPPEYAGGSFVVNAASPIAALSTVIIN